MVEDTGNDLDLIGTYTSKCEGRTRKTVVIKVSKNRQKEQCITIYKGKDKDKGSYRTVYSLIPPIQKPKHGKQHLPHYH